MRFIFVLFMCVCVHTIPMFWRRPCLEESVVDIPNNGISKNEFTILLNVILFELENVQIEFHDYILKSMDFLNHNNKYVELELLQMTSFFIMKSQQRLKMSTFKIQRISELIRILRCELSSRRRRPIPWRQLKFIVEKNLSNEIYVDYLSLKFSSVINEFLRES